MSGAASDTTSCSAGCCDEVLELIHSVKRLEEDNGFSMPGIIPAFEVDLDANRPQADDLDIRDDSLQAMRTKLSQIHETIQPKDAVVPLCFSRLFGRVAAEEDHPEKRSCLRAGSIFQCDMCREVFRMKNSLRSHIAEHLQRPRRKCSSCGATLQTSGQLVDHFVATHLSPESSGVTLRPARNTGQQLRCSVCKVAFAKLTAFRKHLLSHCDVTHFRCPVCEKTFDEKFMLRFHLRLHKDEDVVECTVCGKPYTDKAELLEHLTIHSLGRNFLPCRDCELSFPSKGLLLSHRRTHRAGEVRRESYACPVCGKTCGGRSKLARHAHIHSSVRPHACSRCPKTFGTRKQLTVHFRTHSGERPFCCEVCGKRFPFSNSLTTHLRTHTGHVSHTCRYCDKSFTHRSNMRRHARTHLEDGGVACDACGERFDTTGDYNRHLVGAHRQQSPDQLTCYQCGKRFTLPSNLARHLKLHILYCDICRQPFQARAELLRHFRQHEVAEEGSSPAVLTSLPVVGSTHPL